MTPTLTSSPAPSDRVTELPAQAPFVSVVVPVRNGGGTIADCVTSLLAVDYPPERREVVVVDNGSTDRTAAILRRFPLIRMHEPRRGPSHARNRGILAARGKIIAFTDADCVVDRRWLKELVAGFDHEGVGAVAGEIEPYAPRTATERYLARRERGHSAFAAGLDRPFAPGANLAIRRSALDRVGLFDPAYITAEDVDLSWRLWEVGGYEIGYRPRAVAYHRNRASPRTLLVQQVRYGYGRTMLRQRYGLRPGYALGRPMDLLGALVTFAAATGRRMTGRGDDPGVTFAGLEVLRRVALRLGALAWFLHAPLKEH